MMVMRGQAATSRALASVTRKPPVLGYQALLLM